MRLEQSGEALLVSPGVPEGLRTPVLLKHPSDLPVRRGVHRMRGQQ